MDNQEGKVFFTHTVHYLSLHDGGISSTDVEIDKLSEDAGGSERDIVAVKRKRTRKNPETAQELIEGLKSTALLKRSSEERMQFANTLAGQALAVLEQYFSIAVKHSIAAKFLRGDAYTTYMTSGKAELELARQYRIRVDAKKRTLQLAPTYRPDVKSGDKLLPGLPHEQQWVTIELKSGKINEGISDEAKKRLHQILQMTLLYLNTYENNSQTITNYVLRGFDPRKTALTHYPSESIDAIRFASAAV